MDAVRRLLSGVRDKEAADLREALGPDLADAVAAAMYKAGHDDVSGRPRPGQTDQAPKPESQPGSWKAPGGSFDAKRPAQRLPLPPRQPATPSPTPTPQPAMAMIEGSKIAAHLRRLARRLT